MGIITKVIADYAIFAVYEELIDGTISLKVIDFADECIYNTLTDQASIKDNLTSEEVIDERGRLCSFRLPNGVKVDIDYNEFDMPTKIRVSTGNVKEIEYYESKSIRSIVSYYAPSGAIFWEHHFKDKEAPLENEYEVKESHTGAAVRIKDLIENEAFLNVLIACAISSDNEEDSLNDRYEMITGLRKDAEEARRFFSNQNNWRLVNKIDDLISTLNASVSILENDMKKMEEENNG